MDRQKLAGAVETHAKNAQQDRIKRILKGDNSRLNKMYNLEESLIVDIQPSTVVRHFCSSLVRIERFAIKMVKYHSKATRQAKAYVKT